MLNYIFYPIKLDLERTGREHFSCRVGKEIIIFIFSIAAALDAITEVNENDLLQSHCILL